MTREKRVTVEEAWPLPAVIVAHHITYDGHPDSYPLHMASKILSDGQSSRIYRKLVYDSGLALTAFGGGNIIEHPNLFYAAAIVQPGRSPAEVEAALIAELQRMTTEPVSDARAAARQEPVRARLHPGPRDQPAQGGAAGARGGHSQRHHDRRRRVPDLPAHHGRRYPACRQDLLHADQPARDHHHAQGLHPVTAGARRVALAGRQLGSASRCHVAASQVPNWPSETPPRPLAGPRGELSALRDQDAHQRAAGRRRAAPRAAGRHAAPAGTRGRRAGSAGKHGVAALVAALLDQGAGTRSRPPRLPMPSTPSAAGSAPAPAATSRRPTSS